MEGFLALIDDLKPPLLLLKYVDGSTAFEIMKKSDPNRNALQESMNETVKWTQKKNDMKINAQKTHEIIISFAKDKPNPPPIEIDGENIDRVEGAKLVGLHIQNNLKCNTHVNEITKKAKTKLYFLTQMKR